VRDVRDRGPPDPDLAASRPPSAWSLGLGGLVSAGLLAAICLQLAQTSAAVTTLLAGLSPVVFLSFALLYLTQPVADLVIYRRLWNLPVSGIGALFRKTAINEAVVGYGGELYLYLWARRRADLTSTPFAAVKDVNIISAMMGFAFTLAALCLALAWAKAPDLGRVFQPVLWPAIVVTVIALGALAFARRVFSLRRRDLVFVTLVHGLRLLAACGLVVLTWSLALPQVALDVWIVLLALTLAGARIPFITNTNLLVANVVLVGMGPTASFAVLLAGMAVATLGAHLTVIGALGAQDLWRVIRKPPQLRRSPRAAVADATE
jgi:hypothetical protein